MGVGCVGKYPIMYLAHKGVLWSCYCFLLVVVAFGTTGNILSFRILGYNKSRRNQSSTFYLRALAIADALTLVFNTLLMSQIVMLKPAMNLHPLHPLAMLLSSYPVCNIRMYIAYSTTLVAVYIIVLFSIERALVVTNPLRWMRFFGRRKAKAAVAALTLLAYLICVPSLYSFKSQHFAYPKRLYNLSTNATIDAPLIMSIAKCSQTRGFGPTPLPDPYVNNETTTTETETTHWDEMELDMPNLVRIANLVRGTHPGQDIAGANDTGEFNLTERLKLASSNRRGLLAGIGIECQMIEECRINFPLFKQFVMFHNAALSLVPFIVTGACNVVILLALRGGRGQASGLGKSKSDLDVQDRQVTKKLIVVSTAFIVLTFPQALFHLITGAMTESYCSVFWANAMIITMTLNATNHAVNFIIYCISEEQFRRLLTSLMLCQRHRLTRLLSYINEPRRRGAGGGRGVGGGGGAGGTTGGPGKGRTTTNAIGGTSGMARKFSNPRTNVTTYSVSQGGGQDQVDASEDPQVTEALMHPLPGNGDNTGEDDLAIKLDEAAAEYVKTRRQEQQEENEAGDESRGHDFKNCSFVKDDWASELFAEDDARLRAIMARWSEVTPELD